MASSAAPTLTCAQCGYANEAERVYCHNCGGKLDRTLLPKEDERKKESLEKTRRRVKKLTNPGADPVTREIKAFFKTFSSAAFVAALILFVRPPDNVPDPRPESLPTRIVSSELVTAIESPQPRSVAFTEEEVNAHLRQSLKKASGGLPGVKFERAFVNFSPNVCKITMEQSLWGFPLYTGSSYKLAISEGKLVATNMGGSFGRLSVTPQIMEYAEIALKKLWGALKREREQMDKLRDVRIAKGQITLVTRGTAQ